MKAEILTHCAIVLISLLLDGPGTARDIVSRTNTRAAGLLTVQLGDIIGAVTRLVRTTKVMHVQSHGYALTEAGKAAALTYRQVAAALVDPTWVAS